MNGKSNEMIFELNVKDLKANLDKIPQKILFQRKLETEIEML